MLNIRVDILAAGSSLTPWLIVNSTEVSMSPGCQLLMSLQ